MKDRFTLKIKDAELSDQYEKLRFSQIKLIGIIGVIMRTLHVCFTMINNLIFSLNKFTMMEWILRGA